MKAVLEPIPLGQKKTIHGFRYEAIDFQTPWHFHPQHELTYIEESVGTKLVGDFVGPYEPGELVLLCSNLPHCWKNVRQENVLSKSIVIQWNKDIFPKVPELNVVFDLLRVASKGVLFNKEQSAELLPQIRNLPNLQDYELYVQLLHLLTKLSICSYETLSEADFVEDLSTEYGSRMSTVHDFVSKNFNRRIYLREIADLVHMSEQSFSRFFSKIMGRSFFVFLNEYRINIAVRMLLDTDKSVSQIGYACGYESLPFFYKQFNRFNGCSPLVYQKRFRKS
ncbi:AraC family transcriptional regulator [Flagellimonas algicola]|uniref:AraC family transcriptional regulator n=1 Tax=Flagellimonas algicola TaxID=2583815 RepID=A0ABY2WQQ5_9FLAO|nr:AraC family transcriptional regulator [Allomuricauda algicola]TMU57330.1 AraC family transcriptional regulator [Allomuricauda algicola]